jgi:hypothetical protein
LRRQRFRTAKRTYCGTYLGKTKVENLGVTSFRDEDVRRLDIAVDNPL